jgi:hypothetical protein
VTALERERAEVARVATAFLGGAIVMALAAGLPGMALMLCGVLSVVLLVVRHADGAGA